MHASPRGYSRLEGSASITAAATERVRRLLAVCSKRLIHPLLHVSQVARVIRPKKRRFVLFTPPRPREIERLPTHDFGDPLREDVLFATSVTSAERARP
jgi:hypothetical protein